MGGPTQSIDNQIVDVSVVDVNINWSENWVLQTSSCDPSIKSRVTSSENSFFTYLSNDIGMLSGLVCDVELTRLDTFFVVSTFGSFYYYINVANSNAKWEVFVNGVSQDTFSSNSNGFTNCTYVRSTNLIQLDVSLNITIVVIGSVTGTLADRASTADPWSLEVNMLL